MFDQITKELDAMAAALVEKGIKNPSVSTNHRSGGGTSFYIHGKNVNFVDPDNPDYKAIYGTLADVWAYIAAIPSPKTRALRAHMTRVADCIDKGRADGLDEVLLPVEQMQKLSLMMIEGPKG